MNRDLTPAERETLEALVDSANLGAVLMALSEIAGEKSDHIAQTWADRPLARVWAEACGVCGIAAAKLPRVLHL